MSNKLKCINTEEIHTSNLKQVTFTAEQKASMLDFKSHYGQKENKPYIEPGV